MRSARLGAREAIDKLRALLDDKQQFSVRFSAAEALARLGDTSGVAFLRNTLDTNASNPAASLLRVQAAAALALTGPDSGWMDTSRALLNDPQSHVRVLAAQSLAPYDNAIGQGQPERAPQRPESGHSPARRAGPGQGRRRGPRDAYGRSCVSTDGEARTSAAARILEISR